eukprot:2678200-Pleurochrysis_carterae.AAC.2
MEQALDAGLGLGIRICRQTARFRRRRRAALAGLSSSQVGLSLGGSGGGLKCGAIGAGREPTGAAHGVGAAAVQGAASGAAAVEVEAPAAEGRAAAAEVEAPAEVARRWRLGGWLCTDGKGWVREKGAPRAAASPRSSFSPSKK